MATVDDSVLQLKTFRIEWTVKRFFAGCKDIGYCYKSPVFPINCLGTDTAWYLKIYPKSVNKEHENLDENYVGLYLHFVSESDDLEVTVDYQCTIVSKQNNLCRKSKNKKFKNQLNSWGWRRFVSQDDVKNIQNGALIDDTLKILFEIKFHPANQNLAENFYGDYLNGVASGLDGYEEIFESGIFADVTFNVQKNQIPLHKAILSRRSSVFKAMFENDMIEKKEGLVEITDIDYKVMMELFRFIYAGKVENIEELANDLLIAADKYAVIQLKALCEKTLYDGVTIDNVVKYLKLADMCDTLHLKKLLIKFVADNLKDIVGTSDFNSVFAELNPDILCEILRAVAEKN